MMVALTLLAVIASIGAQLFGSISSSMKEAKLTNDVGTINRAITMYLSSGGDLSDARTPADVLLRLKTTSSAERVKTQINPLTRSMIDARLSAVLQSESEATNANFRAYWNSVDQRFEVANSGRSAGVKAFVLDEAAVPTKVEIEQRASGSMEFARESGWIWDFKDSSDSTVHPTVIPTSIPIHSVTAPAAVQATPAPSRLQPPAFSIPGGRYPADDFDMALRLHNPNPSGSSQIEYSLDREGWLPYRGALTVAPGAEVRAKAVSSNASRLYDSEVQQASYTADLIQLKAPTISLSAESFSDTVSTIAVNIADRNASGLSTLRLDVRPKGGDFRPVQYWNTYSGSFAVSVDDYPEGFDVITYAKAVDPDRYEHSDNTEAATSASFFGQSLTGSVLFVIDASSSMNAGFGGQSRFDAAIQETVDAIWAMDPGQKFNVAMFDAGVHWTDGSGELKEANQANKISMTNMIQGVENDSGTNYQAALGLAATFDPMPETVVFLTDGRPNSTPYAAQLANLVSLGFKVDVFGIELDSNALSRVQAIADATGGTVTQVAP
jgi:type II secretory pathway pseudopilin PulG